MNVLDSTLKCIQNTEKFFLEIMYYIKDHRNVEYRILQKHDSCP
jgi:hypothetical protein